MRGAASRGTRAVNITASDSRRQVRTRSAPCSMTDADCVATNVTYRMDLARTRILVSQLVVLPEGAKRPGIDGMPGRCFRSAGCCCWLRRERRHQVRRIRGA